MKNTTTAPNLKVAISNFHAGQIVYPVASVKAAGRDKVTVDLHWFDQSDRTKLRPASFTGATRDAETWLLAQGVHLDAQGIYGW